MLAGLSMTTYRARDKNIVVITDKSIDYVRKAMPGYEWYVDSIWSRIWDGLTQQRFSWIEMTFLVIIGSIASTLVR